MTIEFGLPLVSEGVESVDIAELVVSEGDVIGAGDVICEVETDKAVAEIQCPHAGTITKIHVAAGDTVSVGQTLVSIDESSRAPVSSAAAAPAPAVSETTAPDPPSATAESSPPDASTAVVTGGTYQFRLPLVSEGVDTVDVAEISVSEGDTISAGDVVIEVETEKAVAEINCDVGGQIEKIHVAAGDTIRVGDLIATLNSTQSAAARQATKPAQPATKAPAATSAQTTDSTPAEGKTAVRSAAALPSPDRPPAPAGPATRRLARKMGVDLFDIKGSGPGGRIVIEDVEAYVKQKLSSPAAGGGSVGSFAVPPLPDFSIFGPVEKQSLSKIFRTAAANLHAAWVTIPHVTQHDLADITDLESARKRYVKSHPESPKITMTSIMIKAVVGALKTYPTFNSSIDTDAGELIVKNYYHIGVAVDTPTGLVVPVIKDCDQKNVLQVADELSELAAKARDRKLKLDDMQGGTFTITNLGGIGGTAFTPIVNHPEVAILGMSRGRKELRLEDGELIERLMLPLSLSYDHRAVNGADAARFIVKLSSSLSNFFELF